MRDARVALSNALSLAVSDGYVVRNVAKAREVAPTTVAPRDAGVDARAAARVPRLVADDRLFALWRLVAMTGMRQGEALGLHWKAMDLDNARMLTSSAH